MVAYAPCLRGVEEAILGAFELEAVGEDFLDEFAQDRQEGYWAVRLEG